ncbi:PhoD-like phosphatase-domain-containing protein [Crucibulum laeve]|uniref:PhoD-like phosphatase-domain-containing protein n=1 Tax=Crucibulum laeve TaxID=68775 RepID=A0A5C3MCG4_9AGAR|nr:PhoD-like phosphatase-domain-containing protein [Crucibulum laeve]
MSPGQTVYLSLPITTTASGTMPPPLTYILSLISSLFRFFSYVFLRVIPTRLGQPVIPTLYISYLFIWYLSSPAPSVQGVKSEKDTVKQAAHSQRPNPVTAILLSLPTASRRVNILNLLINTLLLIATIDFAITPFFDSASDVTFTRVGAVYPDAVKIAIRYPQPNATSENDFLVIWRESSVNGTEHSWKTGPRFRPSLHFDWMDTVRLDNLWPETSYEYMLAFPNGTLLPYPTTPIQFQTFPDPRLHSGSHFRFIVSSCITPNFPYMGPLHRRTIRGFDLLAEYLFSWESTAATSTATRPDASFLLFLGDFIYADVPLYIGDDKSAYRRLYRRNYQSSSFRKIYERLPIFHTYDDHEIINNYGGDGDDSKPPYPSASDAFRIYNANANYDSPHLGQHYYDFRHGDVAFFVMDTRRYRSTEPANERPARTMLGDTQLAALHDWLGRVNGTSTFKFIISSVPFTSLWGHDAAIDSWAGFPTEKQALLTAFHSVPNVIVLSGDRHEFAAIEFSSSNPDSHPVYEFSTSPLNMFYIPFLRTLHLQSEKMVQRPKSDVVITVNGTEAAVLIEEIPQERVLKYIPVGNTKWSSIEINTRDLEKPQFRLETVIDGKPEYTFEMIGTPIKLQSSVALSTFVPETFVEFINKIGINPSTWF